ncbi:hypothetical protein VB773_15275 [Haloarculaceae archaeon H-GB2-1]|nr:hypothetical protein [Haloarculaceae archaeon H-GB1-1]MEA5387325.1 hypothetical protein [Haloarculaceae archaeon H-GB11]MEA5408791.1 hypothetical protein [Haloarculaceae archaeon H-GB2-1]
MSATESAGTSLRWKIVVSVLVATVVGYAVVIAQQVLLGILAGTFVYLLAWLVSVLDTGGTVGSTRALLTAVISLLVIAYALLIVQQILLGVVVVLFVVLVSWLTSPRGPLARYLRSR